MKKLIDIKSKKYIRRMIVELNKRLRSGESVYAQDCIDNYPFKVVKVKSSQGKICVNGKCYFDSNHFLDHIGREICVTRKN